MVRNISKGLSREEYFKLSQEERKRLWVSLFSEKLEISEEEAERKIDRNNSKPIWEILDGSGYPAYQVKPKYHHNHIPPNCLRVFPRINANTMLLAQLSKGGPMGDRPIYVSLENIARISLLDEDSKRIDNWRRILSRDWHSATEVLTELKLTASNPNWAPEGVEFSSEDVRKGVCIPTSLNKPTMQSLGIIYAKGCISKDQYTLRITGTMKDKEFYEDVVRRKMEEVFNLSQDEIYIYSRTSRFSGNQYNTLRLSYISKALATYLLNCIKFPSSDNEKKETGISEKIKSSRYIGEFLNSYLACNARSKISENNQSISICINDTSKPVLEDVQGMLILLSKLQKPSIALSPRKGSDSSYTLELSTISALELYFSGRLNENPRVKVTAEDYLNRHGIGKIAFGQLHEIFGESIVPYRRQRTRV